MGMMSGRQAAGRGCVCQLRQLCALWDFTAGNKTDDGVQLAAELRRKTQTIKYIFFNSLSLFEQEEEIEVCQCNKAVAL